ncbi:MAG TPA: M6 family metalloprotease domain-containing protein, partial [Candidatus Eisenbacteria bacterium]
GSVYDYYEWASAGRLRVVPVVVATVTVPNTRAYYGANSHGLNRTSTPRNEAGLVQDAIQLCATKVDWTSFDLDHDGYVDMLWVIHAGPGGEGTRDVNDLWSTTSQMSLYWLNTYPLDVSAPGGPHMLIDRFSVLPELSLFVPRHISEIGVYCHEFGHALGLPDLYDTSHDPSLPSGFNRGPGDWSLMSTGAYGGNGITPQYPVHPGGWCSIYLGWTQSFRPAQDTVLTLASVPDGGSVLELAFQGEMDPEHFLAECRMREGFDRLLPTEGLVVYHVNDLWIGERIQSNAVNAGPDPALVLVEADGRQDVTLGYNQGDSTDAFPGASGRSWVVDDVVQPSTATFRFVPTSIGLLDIGLQGGGVRFKAQVRAPGWQAPVDHGDPGYLPAGGFGIAPSAVVDVAGNISTVAGETRAGHSQIVLRSRVGGAWQAPIQVSHSSADALDPTIALLPGGDLAVAWSDTRSGRSHIFYSARVRGVWITEQPIENLPGQGIKPAIGADASGVVQVAWTYLPGVRPQVLLERFGYLSPYGQAMVVTGSTSIPGSPSIGVAPDGSSYVVWPDQGTTPQSLRYAQYVPGQGLSPNLQLTPATGVAQQLGCEYMDATGTLHSVWLIIAPGLNEVHYQRRTAQGALLPADTTLDVYSGVVQYVRLGADSKGAIHLVEQVAASGLSQILYRRWRPDRGWDDRSTDVTNLDASGVQRPNVL